MVSPDEPDGCAEGPQVQCDAMAALGRRLCRGRDHRLTGCGVPWTIRWAAMDGGVEQRGRAR